MRVAIIDLGTNTFNLLIAEITDSAFKVIVKEKQAVKLGKSGLKEGQIMPDAFVRGVRAMVHYKNVIDQHQVTEIKAIATSAMRDSSNSGEFQQEILKSTGIQIDIISGQEEASLIQKGVELTLPEGLEDYVIMDVGGGSTEFIIVKNKLVVWSRSYNLGVSRLLDWLNPSDPIAASERDRLSQRLCLELKDLFRAIATHKTTTLIGSSGSFDSIHDMLEWDLHEDYSSNKIDFNEIILSDFFSLHDKLVASTLKERQFTNGLLPMRTDMMVISSLEIFEVIRATKVNKLFRSSYALKEGLLSSMTPIE